jgi:hypothetical protein
MVYMKISYSQYSVMYREAGFMASGRNCTQRFTPPQGAVETCLEAGWLNLSTFTSAY